MSDAATGSTEAEAPAEGAAPAEKKDDHGHGHGHHGHPPYMKIFATLCVLTVIEVVIVVAMAQLEHPAAALKFAANASLVIFSLAKAVLVALYFMHLQMDNKRLMIVVVSPIFLSFLLFLVPVLETLSSQAKL